MDLSRQEQPLYRALAERLRGELHRFAPGDYLPGELSLAARFSVNRHTLRRAVDELVREGRLLRQKGKGTQVLAQPMIYPMQAGSAYTASLSAQGHGVEAVLLGRRIRPASDAEARHLQLEPGSELLELDTLRLIDEQPVSLIRHRYCASREPLLADYRGGSLRSHLAAHGLTLSRAYSLIGARLPEAEEAKRLLMPRHAPLLTVLTLSQDLAGRPVELSYSTSRADCFEYQVAP
ncbi:phosphonate metabolism transcriptional regulator PhnF [Stutzerimonas nosocomialis]|uniref:Phosphonate metabolism transcriptional regulator PhnF n=1 Tax=Stutzerimonas nosocomialis TaxID=1056496 RepID=A0A5R9QDB3_9GAMM|nr:phosphonate metabolism transcriptional regulator PhnF [Stutzerimonas nosocomialis]TLX57890.1 phosphonate metabolism transcriptional regulator PhnF [Stutzerimonas nosocomialis]TLX59746.1 phosphonate metabolism transcriptional regulator PhnF [Stutzerimonas nosocomialis]TLX63126.1 phosphonate metabolism transcriptional regulator PhnF [Stutzerimonas nosocomialis]